MSTLLSLTSAQLKRAADIKDQIEALNQDLSALLGAPAETVQPAVKKFGISEEGRARIAAAAKARWARVKSAKAVAKVAVKPVVQAAVKPSSKKGQISPEGKARIIAAQKARWAKIRAAKQAVKAPAKPVAKATVKPTASAPKKKFTMSAAAKAMISAAAKARWAKIKAGKKA